MGIWFAAQQQVVTLFNLLKRISVVVPAHMTKSASARSPHSDPDKAHMRWKATYEVTGMSPQSMTLAHELNGFASSGTL